MRSVFKQSPRLQVAWILAAAFLGGPAGRLLAGEADDQFAVAAGHYSAQRWELAAEEFQKFLADYPDHTKRIKAAFFLGEALVQSGKLDQAHEQFTAVRKADPNGRYAKQALFRAGECAFLSTKSAEAKVALTAFCEQYADDPLGAYALSYLGELALASGNFGAAKAHYGAVLEKYADGPTADDSRLGLAQSDLGLKEYKEAAEALGELIESKRLTVEANYWLGQVYKAQERWDDAANAFQAGIAANPEHEGAATLRFLIGESLIRAEKYAAAIEAVFGAGGNGDIRSLPATHGFLVALAQQGLKQHAEALAALDALATESDEALARRVLSSKAVSLAALGRHEEAIQALNKGLAATPEGEVAARSEALARLAVAYARTKNFEQSKAALLQLAAIAGQNSEIVTKTAWEVAQIAMAARQTSVAGELSHALAEQHTAPAIATEAQRRLAQLAVESGDLEKGASLYERFLQDHPDGAAAVEAALACADVRERLKQYDAALAMYKLVIEQHSESPLLPLALLRAGTIYDQLSQETVAIEHFERLVRDHSDSSLVPAAIYGWGWCLRDLKRMDEARARFEQLRQDHPDSPYWADATYRLAESAAEAKELDRAVALVNELIDAAERKMAASTIASDDDDEVSDSDHGAADVAPNEKSEPAIQDGAAKVPAETLRHALYMRAQIAIGQSNWRAAEADLERLMREHAETPLAIVSEFLRADVAYRRADYDAAAERFASLAPKLKGRHERWIAMVPLRRAQVFAQQRRWSDARAIAEAISRDFPNFDQQYEADYLLGRCYEADADLKTAREHFQKVVRSPQGSKTETAAMAQWMIGETYFLQEEYAVAIREYLRVEVLYAYPRWQAAALIQAGKCYEQLGQWKDAAESYGRLLKLYPQTDFAAEARERLQQAQSRTAARDTR